MPGSHGIERIPEFERRLRRLLDERKYNTRAFAADLGVDYSTVYKWLNGQARPCLNRLMKVAHKLEVDPNYLLGWSDQRHDLRLAKLTNTLERALEDIGARHGELRRNRRRVTA